MPRLIANTANMSEQKWLELRKGGIGGSDASAVVGANKYSSPVMVYMDKLDFYLPDKPDRVKMAATWGNLHEPTIREHFKRTINQERAEKGLQPLNVIHRQAIFAHDEHDFIRTNLDGVIYDPDLGKGIFEAKTAHYMLREEWEGEDVPNAYFIQVQHNMMVMDVDFGWLAVLIGGNQYKHYFIERDKEFCEYLIQLECKFWNDHILQRIPPEMTGHDAEKEMLKDQYPESVANDGYITALPNSCIALIEKVDAIKKLISELDLEKSMYENEIKATMGTVETAFAGSHKIKWKTSSNDQRRFTYKIDASTDRDKFYDDKRKILDKQRKEIEKEIKAAEKTQKDFEKLQIKARKEADKAAVAALKEAEKALKAAKKEVSATEEVDERINFIEDVKVQIGKLKMEVNS